MYACTEKERVQGNFFFFLEKRNFLQFFFPPVLISLVLAVVSVQ